MAIATFIENSKGQDSCYESFLNHEEIQTKTRIVGAQAIDDFQVFSDNSKRLTQRLRNFEESQDREIAYLVLGRVQSGKTAHLLSTLAWAVDSSVSFATVFTGITGPLNIQTSKRVEKEFNKLSGNFVKVLRVPTKTQFNEFDFVRKTLLKYVEWRQSGNSLDANRPALPILVTMKNPARIEALQELFAEIEGIYGNSALALMIDDEADQASQNAGAQKLLATRTYRDISKLRDINIRNIMLSYTATPQAVLHAPKRGRLRPDYCVRVAPRAGYFGLEDVVGPEFSKNIEVVSDWNLGTLRSSKCPKSLTRALQEFIWVNWIRENRTKQFYSGVNSQTAQFDHLMQSCQMLIHQSVQTDDHHKVHKMVLGQIEDFSNASRSILDLSLGKNETNSFLGQLSAARDQVFGRMNFEGELPEINEDFLREYFQIVENTKVFVVNASSERPGGEEKLPSGDSDADGWDSRPWVLIGGDMLGRGLTIPQLVSTYFLRMARKPNFDTVSQQMRFCGYRSSYRQMCSVFAPIEVLESFQRMRAIDAIMWNRAGQWDKDNVNLKSTNLTILYASTDAKMDPTRKSVRDPNLFDVSYSSENLFSPKRILSPILFRNNMRNIKSWISEINIDPGRVVTKNQHEFSSYSDIDAFQLLKLISMFDVDASFEGDKLAALELLDSEEANYGLSHLPKHVYIHANLINANLESFRGLEIIQNSAIGRASSSRYSNMKTWFFDYTNLNNAMNKWGPLSSPHVGAGQRSLYAGLNSDAILLIIEPVKAWNVGEETTPFALGIAASIIVPKRFKIRTIGFR